MKKVCFVIGICSILLFLIVYTNLKTVNKESVPQINAEEVEKVIVQLLPPDKTYELTKKQITTLSDYVNRIQVLEKDNSWRECVGQLVSFEISFTNGEMLTIQEYSPYIVINGTGYTVKDTAVLNLLSELGNSCHEDAGFNSSNDDSIQ